MKKEFFSILTTILVNTTSHSITISYIKQNQSIWIVLVSSLISKVADNDTILDNLQTYNTLKKKVIELI